MGRKKKRAEEQKPWCWYCDREFLDEPTLVQHQKNKHFKCPDCNRKLNTAQGLCVHAYQVHKRAVTEIPAALPGREGVEREIFGMAGVPPGARPGHPFGDEGEPSAKKAKTGQPDLTSSSAPPPLPPQGMLQNGMSMSGPMGMGPVGPMGPGMGMPMPGSMGMSIRPMSGPMGGPPPPMGAPPLGAPMPPPRPGYMGGPGMGLGGPPMPPPRPGYGPPVMGYGPPGMVPPPRGLPGVPGVPPTAAVAPGGPPPPVPPVPPPGMMAAGPAGVGAVPPALGMVPPPGMRPPGGPLFPISGSSSTVPASSGPSSGGAPQQQQQPLFPVMGGPAAVTPGAAGIPGAVPGVLPSSSSAPPAAADGLQPPQQQPVGAPEMRLVWADDEFSMEERRSMLPKFAAARQRAQQKGVGFNGPGISPQQLQTAAASS